MAETKKTYITYEDIAKVNSEIDMIDLHGKDYAIVAERVNAYRKLFPEGFIKSQIVSITEKTVLIRACVGYYREDGSEKILATGSAQETFGRGVNATNPIENCETSAIGRALGFMGIGSKTDIASAEEMVNAIVKKREAIKEFNETGKDEIVKEKLAQLEKDVVSIDGDHHIVRKDAPATVTTVDEIPM